MQRKISLFLTTLAFLNSGFLFSRCCSHSIWNDSGKTINTVQVETRRADGSYYNWANTATVRLVPFPPVPADGKRNFPNVQSFRTTQQTIGGSSDHLHRFVVIAADGQQKITTGDWEGNSNFIIKPDLSVVRN